ncbi:MAG TPA: CsbD family protein [Pusillimonas sp.]|jgi:uncharacterized protein YjbJ (UPF0337 family)|nr:general stress protein CsbD [Pusillimonas sp.]MBC42002.1 general stress protein CsbD [Pusillimonas sp.]HBT34050.1 CsbD family protein [Pusillimonas sp.]HCN70967.1 CsbD family protein [Pusillimonas sp.]HCP78043.1 CsbD family protein [Pusillimonas sp.]|tara:strand:- start:12389 stop:12595 length:207 start_codon:yes stop_codon:yes gene_type:complete
MNKDIAEGKWDQLKGSVKEKWGDLTDDDVTKVKGSAEKMCGVLQEKYGKSREQAEKEVNDFWGRHNQP